MDAPLAASSSPTTIQYPEKPFFSPLPSRITRSQQTGRAHTDTGRHTLHRPPPAVCRSAHHRGTGIPRLSRTHARTQSSFYGAGCCRAVMVRMPSARASAALYSLRRPRVYSVTLRLRLRARQPHTHARPHLAQVCVEEGGSADDVGVGVTGREPPVYSLRSEKPAKLRSQADALLDSLLSSICSILPACLHSQTPYTTRTARELCSAGSFNPSSPAS